MKTEHLIGLAAIVAVILFLQRMSRPTWYGPATPENLISEPEGLTDGMKDALTRMAEWQALHPQDSWGETWYPDQMELKAPL